VSGVAARGSRDKVEQKEYFERKKNLYFVLDIHESVHCDATTKVTNKMQL
jgi:hypothetical protein